MTTDQALCDAVRALYPALTAFERSVIALATLRVSRGEALKPAQREALRQMLAQHPSTL